MGMVHRFASELRPAALDDLGLSPALRALAGEASKECGFQLRMSVSPKVEQLTGDQCTVLYRVAEEGLRNIRRHANAGHVKLSIRQYPAFVRMDIKDDGRGLDVKKVFSDRPFKCLGLLGMRERVEMVGGTFTMESVPGAGTTLRADIPVAPPTSGSRISTRRAPILITRLSARGTGAASRHSCPIGTVRSRRSWAGSMPACSSPR